MAINLSARCLGGKGAGLVSRACKMAMADGRRGRLVIEMTETAFIERISETQKMLEELRRSGAAIAVDDFGTGYSSLAYLQRLPLDKLKIDRSFVGELFEDRTSRDIVAAIITLAKSLDLVTVAEGVETQEQRRLLATLGCDLLQGFLISRPLPLDEMLRWLERDRADGAGGITQPPPAA